MGLKHATLKDKWRKTAKNYANQTRDQLDKHDLGKKLQNLGKKQTNANKKRKKCKQIGRASCRERV